MRWSENDLAAARARLTQANVRPNRVVKRARYRAVRTQYQGRTFDSKHELAQFKSLELQKALGAIRAVIPQVSVPLPGTSRRARIDFMLVENDGRIRFLDAKGHETQISNLKRQQLLDAYGITVELC